MVATQPRPALNAILVLPASRAASRELGPLAWLMLEKFALEAETERTLAIGTSVRALAAEFGVGKEAAGTALARLIDFGLVRCQTRRRAGRYAGSAYILDADACRRAGLVIMSGATVNSPSPETPCPVRRDAAERHTAQRDTADAAARAELAYWSTPSRRDRHRVERAAEPRLNTTEQSLFDFSDQQRAFTSTSPEPLTPTTPVLSTTPALPTSQPDRPSCPLLPLTPTCQSDTSAPEVRQRGVGSL